MASKMPRVKIFGFHLTDIPKPTGQDADGGGRYDCQYCLREFGNSQALGGHKKAHKRAREQMKNAHAANATAIAAVNGAYLTMASYGEWDFFFQRSSPFPTPPMWALPSVKTTSDLGDGGPFGDPSMVGG